jgi:hypothetical protein
MVRALNEGADAGVTPDGPRGPAREFKPGGLLAAQLSGAPIIPIAVDGAPAWRLRSWDRFAVPKPFARIRVRYGPAHFIPRESTAEARAEHAIAVASALNALETLG